MNRHQVGSGRGAKNPSPGGPAAGGLGGLGERGHTALKAGSNPQPGWSHFATNPDSEMAVSLLDIVVQLMPTSHVYLHVQAWTARWRSASWTHLCSWHARIAP